VSCAGVWCALGSAIALAILSPSPSLEAQTVSEQTFYSFSSSNGAVPTGVIQASDGNFYGTTLEGGSSTGTGECVSGSGSTAVDVGCGTIFQQMLPAFVYVLHDFDGADGADPGPLVEGPDGNFYGTALFGGPDSYGTIFRVSSLGTFTLLYSFTGGTDGAYPNLMTLGNDGNFYGTALEGGAYGYGTIFKLTPSGTLTTLYSFSGGSDGAFPTAPVQGSNGGFYATTQGGGDNSECVATDITGCGTVFSYSVSGGLSTILTFGVPVPTELVAIPQPIHINKATTGQNIRYIYAVPNALVENSDGSFYGTSIGAFGNSPIVFKITPAGNFTTLYQFTGNGDGGGSLVSLALAGDGNFYGSSGNAIFRITPAGTFSVPYTFTSASNGASPWLLTQGNTGDLYGAALFGGNTADCSGNGCGTLFGLGFSPTLPAPVQLTFSSSSVAPGTAVKLNWSVLNAFSATLQQCYAVVEGGIVGGAGTWAGLQTGTVSSGVYGGSATITPTAAGNYTYGLTCGGQESGFAQLTVLPPAVTTASLPGGFTEAAYSAALAAADGLAPYTWSVTSGSLPAGLTLNATTGVISGTPTQAGTSNFTVAVKDSESQPLTATANLSLTVVAAAVSANPSTLSITAPGDSASTTLTISGFAASSITLACSSGLPSEANCTFGTPAASNGSETVSLQISTTAASNARLQAPWNKRTGNVLYALALPGGLWLACLWGAQRRRQWIGFFLGLLLVAAISMTACGGSGAANSNSASTNPGTPAGSSTVVVTATGGTQSVTLDLTVNVQ
jgi:uncharacterized repeat protein (TIGR03803 family)